MQINIQTESTEFLRLQALGCCNQSCKKRLTKLSLATNTKEQLKDLYVLFSDMYFGLTPFSSHQKTDFSAIEQILNNIRSKVSQCEQDLVDYISMIVAWH